MLIYHQPHHSPGGAAAAATAQLVPTRFSHTSNKAFLDVKVVKDLEDNVLINSSDPLDARHGSHELNIRVLLKGRADQGFHSLPHLLNRLSKMLGRSRVQFCGIINRPSSRTFDLHPHVATYANQIFK